MRIRDIFKDRILTLSNILTVIRIILAPFLGYCIYRESITGDSTYLIYEIGIVAVIIITDFFDGFFARLMHQVTKLGQFLDPVADKFAGVITLTFLVLYKGFPLWIYSLIIVRETGAVIAGAVLFAKKNIEVKPHIIGKLGVSSLALSGMVYILSLDYSYMGITLKQFTLFLVVLLYILGGLVYVKKYIRYSFEK
jgi:CDP-diacylglycerol--glycerol-3-phosphate 3-phosphatidyltransferase